MIDKNAPWNKAPPKHAGATGKHLTPAQIEEAKMRAAKAGRRYPNLVDNMAVASGRTGTTEKPPAKTTAKKANKTAKKTAKKKVKALGGRAGARQKTAARRLAKKNKTARRRKK